MKKYIKVTYFCIVLFILLLFIPPLIEGFDKCVIDTVPNLKITIDVAELKEDLKGKNAPQPLTAKQAALSNKAGDSYNNLNDNMSSALNTI